MLCRVISWMVADVDVMLLSGHCGGHRQLHKQVLPGVLQPHGVL